MSLTLKPAAVAASLALIGTGGGAAVLATQAGATTPKAPSAVSHAAAPTGTATISLTGPKGITHTHKLAVSCKLSHGRYVVIGRATGTRAAAKAGSRGAKGRAGRMGLRLTVKDPHGAGAYTGRAELIRRHGNVSTVRHLKVPVTLTSDGGAFKWSKTLSGKHHAALAGKTVSASASWTCSL